MGIKLKYLMVKQVLHKGYTLLEGLFVILFLSVFVLYINFNEYIKVLHLKSLIEKIQVEAFVNEEEKNIEIQNDYLYVDNRSYKLNVSCSNRKFHFNSQGNISNALTLQCGRYQIVLQLGSGSIEIR